jgi:hypothetical protein
LVVIDDNDFSKVLSRAAAEIFLEVLGFLGTGGSSSSRKRAATDEDDRGRRRSRIEKEAFATLDCVEETEELSSSLTAVEA